MGCKIKWGDYHASGKRRGGVQFEDIVIGEWNVRPAFWLEIRPQGERFTLSVWGWHRGHERGDKQSTHRSEDLAMEAAQAHITQVYRGYLREKLANLDAERNEVLAALG